MYQKISIQQEDFSCGDEIAELRRRAHGGAICLLSGIVRDFYRHRAVHDLVLEHYPGMTERSIEKIVQRAQARWVLTGTTVIHRVGRLPPGNQIVLVCCMSQHRADAFSACQFIMDFLKTEAVFWKKEITPDSERWVESFGSDYANASRWGKDRDT